jgi:hypothetical protein
MLCNITGMYYVNNCDRIILRQYNHGTCFDLLRIDHEGNGEHYVIVVAVVPSSAYCYPKRL